MKTRKTYDSLSIEIDHLNKQSSVFYVQCDYGELAKLIHEVYNIYQCSKCRKYYKNKMG